MGIEGRFGEWLAPKAHYTSANITIGGAGYPLGQFHQQFLAYVEGMKTGMAGRITLIAGLWDAVSDPVMGILTDRTKSKLGRHRPYLIISAIPFAIAYLTKWTSFGISAKTGFQIDELRALMQGKICLFSGHSGVGKSALVNALDPSLNVRIGAISDYHEKGKHTTTFAEMHHLGFDAWIVDTPGIKEFVLYDLEKETLAQRFPEMRELMSECRFANCTHTHEPGCAVKTAVENGDIADWRYVNYMRMMTDESHESIKEEL